MFLELNKVGWKIDWREGTGTIYIKDDIKVILSSQTDYLLISLEE
ncbi:hypothetical protein [Bacillus sp. HNG]|nr:hypothetical protein [Bacillus sp. HNG]